MGGGEEGGRIPAIHPEKVEADPPISLSQRKSLMFSSGPSFSVFLSPRRHPQTEKEVMGTMPAHPRFRPASAPPRNRVAESHEMSPGWSSFIELNEMIFVGF